MYDSQELVTLDLQDRARLAFAELQLHQERGDLTPLTQGQVMLHSSVEPEQDVPALHDYCAMKLRARGWGLNS